AHLRDHLLGKFQDNCAVDGAEGDVQPLLPRQLAAAEVASVDGDGRGGGCGRMAIAVLKHRSNAFLVLARLLVSTEGRASCLSPVGEERHAMPATIAPGGRSRQTSSVAARSRGSCAASSADGGRSSSQYSRLLMMRSGFRIFPALRHR